MIRVRTVPRGRRSGAILICVLTCTLIALSLAAAAMQLSLQSLRASKQTLRLRQTQWLLDAGIQRARRAVLRQDYSGERWSLSAEQLAGEEGVVIIEVELRDGATPTKETDDSAQGLATVTARYGDSPADTIQRSYTFAY